MEDQELLRYSKQIMLPQVDVEGQQKIMDSTVLIIGMEVSVLQQRST